MPKWERTLDCVAVCSKTASAMGERQMLPRQTKRTLIFSVGSGMIRACDGSQCRGIGDEGGLELDIVACGRG